MKKNSKALNLILVMMILLTGCGKEAYEDVPLIEDSTDMPAVVRVTYEDIEDMDVKGAEMVNYTSVLKYETDGKFEEYHVKVGDHVEAGTLIASTINEREDEIRELKKQIFAAETAYNNTIATFDLQLDTNLWRAGEQSDLIEVLDEESDYFRTVCVNYELQCAEGERIQMRKNQYIRTQTATLNYLREKLSRAQKKSQSNNIVAPTSGTILYLEDVKRGDSVGSNNYAVLMSQGNEILIQTDYVQKAAIDEMERVYACKDNKQYELTYYPYKDNDYENRSAHGEHVYAYFKVNNPDESIRLGDTCVVIFDKATRSNVLTVPINAIVYDQGESYVYKFEDNKRSLTKVEVGLKDKTYAEILSGLKEGDYVYVSN